MKAGFGFSVIIPVHNKERHLKRCLDSVLNQAYQNFEILAVDDASTDRSRAVIETYSDPRIQLLIRDVPGPGGYAARNLGIEKSKYDWIAFLDADDEWNIDHLQKSEALILKYPQQDYFTFAYHINNGQTNVLRTPNKLFPNEPEVVLDFEKFLDSTLSKAPPIWTSVLVARKSTFVEIGAFPEGIYTRGGDTDAWMRLAFGTEGVWSSAIGATYFIDSDNMVTKTVKDELAAPYWSTEKILDQVTSRMSRKVKQYNNYYQKFPIILAKRAGTLTWKYFRGFYRSASPILFMFLLIYWITPAKIEKLISRK